MLGSESSGQTRASDSDEGISGYLDAGIDDLRRFAEHMRTLTGRWLGFGRFRATALDFLADYLANSPALPA